jgi:hypothetical protein
MPALSLNGVGWPSTTRQRSGAIRQVDRSHGWSGAPRRGLVGIIPPLVRGSPARRYLLLLFSFLVLRAGHAVFKVGAIGFG